MCHTNFNPLFMWLLHGVEMRMFVCTCTALFYVHMYIHACTYIESPIKCFLCTWPPTCSLMSSITVELERSLASCLRTIFLRDNKATLVVIRFWKPLLDALINFVVRGPYSHCCNEMQVRQGIVKVCTE